jgi:hypothetical protein
MSTETWFLCPKNIQIVYVPIHMYEEFCFDYKSCDVVRWRVYETDEFYVAFCLSDAKNLSEKTSYSDQLGLLSKNIGNFLILNRSFNTYIGRVPHKLSFVEEIGLGPIDKNTSNIIPSLIAIFNLHEHHPPHYLRLF